MRNGITDLRNHLFATIEALQDPEKPMDIDRAKTIAEVARTVIESAKVEVDFLKVTGQDAAGTGFIPTGQITQGENGKGVGLKLAGRGGK